MSLRIVEAEKVGQGKCALVRLSIEGDTCISSFHNPEHACISSCYERSGGETPLCNTLDRL
jgi:hypothetical protein